MFIIPPTEPIAVASGLQTAIGIFSLSGPAATSSVSTALSQGSWERFSHTHAAGHTAPALLSLTPWAFTPTLEPPGSTHAQGQHLTSLLTFDFPTWLGKGHACQHAVPKEHSMEPLVQQTKARGRTSALTCFG